MHKIFINSTWLLILFLGENFSIRLTGPSIRAFHVLCVKATRLWRRLPLVGSIHRLDNVKKHHFMAIHQSNLSEINFTHGIINLLKKVKQIYTKVNLISETFKRHQSGGYLIKINSGCIHLKFSVIPLPSFPTYTKKTTMKMCIIYLNNFLLSNNEKNNNSLKL